MANGQRGAPLGNQNGLKKNRIFGDMLRRVIIQDDDGSEPQKMSRLRKICVALVDKAEAGDITAICEIRNTLDGKPVQAIEGAGDDGRIVVELRKL
jgi:hypothetical protein